MMLWLLATLSLAAPPCALDVPPDSPFRVQAPPQAHDVRLMIEIWPELEDATWVDEMLTALEARSVAGAVLLPVPQGEVVDPRLMQLALRAAKGGHEVGFVFRDDQVPLDALASTAPMKRRLKPVRRATGSGRLAAAPLPSRTAEAILGTLGFRTVLQTRGPATAVPRPAAVFEGQPRIGAVLQAGPYAGPCGIRPFASPFTPAAADRATQAAWGAARIEGVPVLRVAVRSVHQTSSDAEVLGRWLDEVLVPAGVRPTTPERARRDALAFFRTGRVMDTSPLEAGGGRLVSLDEVRAAAAALDDENILPKSLPGDLNLTEAFFAFAMLLAGDNEGEVVRLGALTGPQVQARSAIDGIVELDRDAVVALAKALLADLPATVPSSLPLDGHTVNAPELLTAFAAAVRDDPRVWPTASPEPHAPDQGWGSSTLP